MICICLILLNPVVSNEPNKTRDSATILQQLDAIKEEAFKVAAAVQKKSERFNPGLIEKAVEILLKLESQLKGNDGNILPLDEKLEKLKLEADSYLQKAKGFLDYYKKNLLEQHDEL